MMDSSSNSEDCNLCDKSQVGESAAVDGPDVVPSSSSDFTGSLHVMTDNSSNSEDNNLYGNSEIMECVTIDTVDVVTSSSSDLTGSSHKLMDNSGNLEDSNLCDNSDKCATVDRPDVVPSSCSDLISTGSSHAATDISSKSEDSNSHGNSHVADCATVDASNVVASSSSDLTGRSHKPTCFSELPEVVMHNIYRCLSLKDLISIRDVCDTWNVFTNRTSVWRHVPLEFYHDDDVNVKNPFGSPYIHTIKGSVITDADLFVNTMINYLQDLRRLCCSFMTYLPAVLVSKMVNKFPNLECILLDFSAPDIMESLSVLQNCPKLREIKFADFRKLNLSWTSFFDMLDKIKTLDTLKLDYFSNYITTSDILYLLELKMRTLVSLKVSFDPQRVNDDVLDNISTITSKIISYSDRLEKLRFTIWLPKAVDDLILNFSQIQNLKYLFLSLPPETSQNTYAQLSFPSSLQFVEIYLRESGHISGVLERIINSCPNLKELHYCCLKYTNINEQLEQVHRLQNLHTIDLDNCPYLSNQGLQYISKCSELRKLSLSYLKELDYSCLKACKYLQELELHYCDINPYNLAETILSLERLTRVSIRDSVAINEKGYGYNLYTSKDFDHIFMKCREKNPVLNICISFLNICLFTD